MSCRVDVQIPLARLDACMKILHEVKVMELGLDRQNDALTGHKTTSPLTTRTLEHAVRVL